MLTSMSLPSLNLLVYNHYYYTNHMYTIWLLYCFNVLLFLFPYFHSIIISLYGSLTCISTFMIFINTYNFSFLAPYLLMYFDILFSFLYIYLLLKYNFYLLMYLLTLYGVLGFW